eukprot:6464843-Amphidinium_carterae.1
MKDVRSAVRGMCAFLLRKVSLEDLVQVVQFNMWCSPSPLTKSECNSQVFALLSKPWLLESSKQVFSESQMSAKNAQANIVLPWTSHWQEHFRVARA